MSVIQKSANQNEEIKKMNGLLEINNSIIRSSRLKGVDQPVSSKNIPIQYNPLSLQTMQRKNFQKSIIKQTLLSSLTYNSKLDESIENMEIPNEDTQIVNIDSVDRSILKTMDNSKDSKGFRHKTTSLRSLPTTTPRIKNSNSNLSILNNTQVDAGIARFSTETNNLSQTQPCIKSEIKNIEAETSKQRLLSRISTIKPSDQDSQYKK